MSTITTVSGRRLWIAWGIPQVDGGYRYLCCTTRREAVRINRIIVRDETMIDALGADVVIVEDD